MWKVVGFYKIGILEFVRVDTDSGKDRAKRANKYEYFPIVSWVPLCHEWSSENFLFLLKF